MSLSEEMTGTQNIEIPAGFTTSTNISAHSVRPPLTTKLKCPKCGHSGSKATSDLIVKSDKGECKCPNPKCGHRWTTDIEDGSDKVDIVLGGLHEDWSKTIFKSPEVYAVFNDKTKFERLLDEKLLGIIEGKEYLTKDERGQVHKRFGDKLECSFAKDKNGYYCYTHRARSKSYKTIDSIPKSDVEFIGSTG